MKYLVVFEEAGGPEAYLEDTKEKAVSRIQTIRDECFETDDDMRNSVTVYEVTTSYKYNPPVVAAGLVEERSF